MCHENNLKTILCLWTKQIENKRSQTWQIFIKHGEVFFFEGYWEGGEPPTWISFIGPKVAH